MQAFWLINHAPTGLLAAFAKQIGWCESLGSPFTARLLTILRDDIAVGGASAELTPAWPGDPVADALALRMASALHALALIERDEYIRGCADVRLRAVQEIRDDK